MSDDDPLAGLNDELDRDRLRSCAGRLEVVARRLRQAADQTSADDLLFEWIEDAEGEVGSLEELADELLRNV